MYDLYYENHYNSQCVGIKELFLMGTTWENLHYFQVTSSLNILERLKAVLEQITKRANLYPRGKAWESPNHSQLMVAYLWVPYAGQNRNLCNTKHGKGEFLYYWKYMLTG